MVCLCEGFRQGPCWKPTGWTSCGRCPYSGRVIDSPSVTSLHDKKPSRGKRTRQSIEPLLRGAQSRGDALLWTQTHAGATLASAFEDVQTRCFILRPVLPTRSRFLVDLTFFPLLLRVDQDLTRRAAGENMCERRSAKGTDCLRSLKEKE